MGVRTQSNITQCVTAPGSVVPSMRVSEAIWTGIRHLSSRVCLGLYRRIPDDFAIASSVVTNLPARVNENEGDCPLTSIHGLCGPAPHEPCQNVRTVARTSHDSTAACSRSTTDELTAVRIARTVSTSSMARPLAPGPPSVSDCGGGSPDHDDGRTCPTEGRSRLDFDPSRDGAH